MRTSSRGEVDPFIVMDVMEAARAEEARGNAVIHMEVGQPGTPAPRGRARRAGAGDGRGAARLHRRARPAGASGSASPGSTGTGTALDLDPRRVVVTAGSSAAFILAFTSLFERGERVAIGDPGYPSYRNILRALDLVPVGIATGPEDRFQPVPARPDARPGRGAGGEPGQSHRHHAGALRARRADRARGRARPRLRLGRDLPRHPVRRPRRLGAGDRRRRLRHQLLLEILLDDRLADRLDGGAGGARPPHRAAGAEPLHLRAAREPGGGAGRPRCSARTRRQPGGLPRQPRADARGSAAGGLHPHRAAGRRLLHLCRRLGR